MVDFNKVTILWIGSQSILLNLALGDQLNWLTHKLKTWTFFTVTPEIDLIFISTVLKTVNWHNRVKHGSHYFSKPILSSNYLIIWICWDIYLQYEPPLQPHTNIFIFIYTVFKKVNWHNTVNHGSHYFSKPILGSNYLKISILKGSLIK